MVRGELLELELQDIEEQVSRIRRAFIDQGVQLPQNLEIGFDHDADRHEGYVVTDSGIVVAHHAPAGNMVRSAENTNVRGPGLDESSWQ
jgi:ADP-glucose pyrophosphorylase